MICWVRGSAASFDCCCTSINFDCKQPFVPIKILDYNGKHLHSVVAACVCGNSAARHYVILNNCIMFSIAGGAVTKLMIASISVCGLENLQAISESGNILLNRTYAQSTDL